MGIPHKHAKMINAWANGSAIQVFDKIYGCWTDTLNPSWEETFSYRVKHKHQNLIDAFEKGESIQYFDAIFGTWECTKNPFWDSNIEYRIKPKPVKVEFEDPTDSIEDILDCFDFEKVKKVMDFLDWQWYDTGVPEIWDLRKRARILLNNVWNDVKREAEKSPDKENRYFIATGGFYVEAIKYPESPKVYLTLKFQIADWDNFE